MRCTHHLPAQYLSHSATTKQPQHEPCRSCTAGLIEWLNIPIATASHLELGVWEPSDPKQQRRANSGRRGCESAIVRTAQCPSLGQPTHQMSKSNGATIQKSKAGRVLPLEIIEHDGVRHDLAEAGHRVKLSDDLCTQTERNRESGRLYTSGEEAGHDTSSTADRGRGCVASGGPRGHRQPPEAGSRRLCRPRSQPDRLKQRPGTGETGEQDGQEATAAASGRTARMGACWRGSEEGRRVERV